MTLIEFNPRAVIGDNNPPNDAIDERIHEARRGRVWQGWV